MKNLKKFLERYKVDGYIVENHNSYELKKGIDWISGQVENNNLLGRNAQKKIQNYDSELISQKYISLYEKLYSNRNEK